MLDGFTSFIPNMKFTLEKEKSNKINFLEITIAKDHDGLSFEIYRKPTTTDGHNTKWLVTPQGAQNSSNQILLQKKEDI